MAKLFLKTELTNSKYPFYVTYIAPELIPKLFCKLQFSHQINEESEVQNTPPHNAAFYEKFEF